MHEKLRVGDFVIDQSRNLLSGPNGDLALEPKVVDVLFALAACPGEVVTRDALIDAIWKTEFGADERVTRAISLLRKAFADERGAPRYIETIPKRGYRLVATVRPFGNGEAGSPAPGVIKMQAPEPVAASAPALDAAPPSSSRPFWHYAAGVAAALGLAGVAAFLWYARSAAPPGHDVVQLEALTVIGGPSEGSAGFAQQVHASLKRTLATNGVALFDAAADKAAAATGEFSLSGSVERVGEDLAVNLFFTKTANGHTLWSKRFQRPAAEAEVLREEAGVNAAFVAKCALKERRAARVKPSLEAFKIYVESCDPAEAWANAARKRAVAQRLIAIAPHDPLGHALSALASAHLAAADLKLTKSEADLMRSSALASMRRVREIDPGNALAQVVELVMKPQVEQWRNIEALRQASDAHEAACGLYFRAVRSMGRLKEALYTAERAAAEAVLLPYPRTWHATVLMQTGQHEEAERLFEITLRTWPEDKNTRFYHLVNMMFYGDADKAAAMVFWLPERQACHKAFIELRRRGGASRSDLDAVKRTCAPENDSQRDYLTRMLAALGDIDGAYAAASGTFAWRGSTHFLFYPEMATFRRDARFMPFIAKSGLLEAWLETDQWPDFCADKDLPYDCKTAARQALNAPGSEPGARSELQPLNKTP
jgi:DNA-binding winged helix-turn-helix (wHTH) protein/tetratricopeptide (TPR) repeat protein